MVCEHQSQPGRRRPGRDSQGNFERKHAAQDHALPRSRSFCTYHLFRTASDPGETALADLAARDAFRRARTLADITGAGDIAFAGTYRGVSARAVLGSKIVDPFSFDEGVPVDEFHPIALDGPARQPTPLVLVKQALFAGNQIVRAPAILPIAAQRNSFYLLNSGGLPPLQPTAEIAADRPELYVIGMAANRPSLRSGLSPEYAAIVDARRRTALLAGFLGVTPEYESLFALFPQWDSADGHAVGVATTFFGWDPQSWRRLPHQRQTRSVESAAAPMVAMTPIFASDEQTLIRTTSTVFTRQRPDGVQIDADISSALGSHAPLSNANSIARQMAARLKRLPYVLDVGWSVPPSTLGRNAQYEIVVRSTNLPVINAAVDMLEAGYKTFSPRVRLHATAFTEHCELIEQQLMQEAVRRNSMDAARLSVISHRPLRKLLLAEVFPLTTREDTCHSHLQMPGMFGGNNTGWALDVPDSLPIALSATLVFRTFPKRD